MKKRILILKACGSSDEPHECNRICEQIRMYEIKPVCNFVDIREDGGPETPGETGPSSSSEKKEKAKAKIQSLSTIDEAKRILDALCDLGYDSVLDTILK